MKMRYHFKAIITDKKNNVLSIGENNYNKSHPYMAKMAMACGEDKKIFLHAEIAAIVKCRELKKADSIYIHRIRNNGDIELANPCKICKGANRLLGLKINPVKK